MYFKNFITILTAFALAGNSVSAQMSDTEKVMKRRGLVNVQETDPEIRVEMKYSTTDNFVKKDIYGAFDKAYLQPEIARRLATAAKLLRKSHPEYRLLIYDAARPNSAQYALWDALDNLKIPASKKTMYVADPKLGSNHNFGCAIDLTVVDGAGKPLDMGTPYDFFGPLAYPRMEGEMLKQGKLTPKQLENRKVLRNVMVQSGFKVNTTEWWHFDGMSKKAAREKYGMIE